MQIEKISIKLVTVSIFLMIGIVAAILSLLAGSYFKQAALDAQMSSLSRVIEVAAEEMLKEVRGRTFNLGMRLGHSAELVSALKNIDHKQGHESLADVLDDPFINGFVGYSKINLEKIRVYNLNLELVSESRTGLKSLDKQLAEYLKKQLLNRHGIDRLKVIDALWVSPVGPLYSTIVPIGGLHLQGYLEIIIDPSLNLPDIGKITKTPISIFSVSGSLISEDNQQKVKEYLPVKFTMLTSDGKPAFRIVGYEDVDKLNNEMEKTQWVTTSGFLLLTLSVLLFALWLFNRFLFLPVEQMIQDMKKMAAGKLDGNVNKKALRELYVLAETFNVMSNQIKVRTSELRNSQNRLLKLLDLDESAILYIGDDSDVIYFNKGACDLFGFSGDEMSDLYLTDLFTDDLSELMRDTVQVDASVQKKIHTALHCINHAGGVFQSDAVINALDFMGESGYAIALNSLAINKDIKSLDNEKGAIGINEQRMSVVEQSLNSLLEIARNNPGLLGVDDQLSLQAAQSNDEKAVLREHAVNVMRAALSCWEHDLEKSKLDLAEESKIWPVYMDKSTPTTRSAAEQGRLFQRV
jgi:PAS domain S-box-containing protein